MAFGPVNRNIDEATHAQKTQGVLRWVSESRQTTVAVYVDDTSCRLGSVFNGPEAGSCTSDWQTGRAGQGSLCSTPLFSPKPFLAVRGQGIGRSVFLFPSLGVCVA